MFASSQPAYASANWQAFTTNSNWHCGPTGPTGPEGALKAQTCVIANSGGYAQHVVVVSNYSGYAVSLDATIREFGEKIPTHNCNSTTMNSGFQRACFGATVYIGCDGAFAMQSSSDVVVSGYTRRTASTYYRHYC